MCDRDYYPAGAYDDPNAPYNQVDPPEVEFDCSATVVLNKDTTVTTDRVYWDGDDWVLCDGLAKCDAFVDNYTDILDLLDELVKYIDQELATKPDYKRREQLEKMKESAKGWTIIDEEYE